MSARVAISSAPFATRTAFSLSGKAMILPLLRSAMNVVLPGLGRCLFRKRDSTVRVMLADAQPRNSAPRKIGIRTEMIGEPVSGLIEGSVTTRVWVVFAD